MFQFDFDSKCFVNAQTRQKAQGAKPLLQRLFYPHYSYEAASLNSCEAASRVHALSHRHARQTKLKHAWNAKQGISKGLFADQNIGKSITRFKSNSFSVQHMRNNTSGYVRKFWQLMCRQQLTPISSQVAVGFQGSSKCVATACDVLCYHSESKSYCIIELKTGFQNYYFKCSRRPMNAPLRDRTDCVYNQHQLQLWLTHHLYQLTYPQHPMMPPLLVRMYPEGMDVYPLESWIVDRSAALFAVVCNALNKTEVV